MQSIAILAIIISEVSNMLLQEKMKSISFSQSEKTIIDFILNKQEAIESYSINDIAHQTYTSASTLIRIAHKLGFKGWTQMKQAFLNEVKYLQKNFKNINANQPFSATDSIHDIASKIFQTKNESLLDTLSLLQQEQIKKAIKIMQAKTNIKFFALANIVFLGEEFVYKLRHINKNASTYPIQNTMYQEALLSSNNDCAIILSYSGESPELLHIAKLLSQKQVPVIAITSIGNNRLEKLADITLHITTRENSYTKIAGFSSLESASFILDILYSTYFSLDYQNNFATKVNLSKLTEKRRLDNTILNDDNNFTL